MQSDITVIILAAGSGTRMQSDVPKVLHKIAGRPMLEYLLALSSSLGIGDVRVVLNEALMIHPQIEALSQKYKFQPILQKKQFGTGDAVKVAVKSSALKEVILILYGDAPFITNETILALLKNVGVSHGSTIAFSRICDRRSEESKCSKAYSGQERRSISLNGKCYKSDVAFVAFHTDNPAGCGRVILNKEKEVIGITEEKDATIDEKNIKLCNGGTIAVRSEILLDFFQNYSKPLSNTAEHYMTDIISFCHFRRKFTSYVEVSQKEVQGINDRLQLSNAEAYMQDSLRRFWMERGVTMIDPGSVFLACDTKIGKDVTIYPNVFMRNNVEIANNVEILPFSSIEGAYIAENATIGPFARIRPGTVIHSNAKVGNFVEVKNSEIGSKTKVMHLSYVGDAKIGKDSNVGAGVIFCNYDGKKKSRCVVGYEAYIGANTSIIASRSIGNNVTIGAGSTITSDIPDKTLALSRVEQKNSPKIRIKPIPKGGS